MVTTMLDMIEISMVSALFIYIFCFMAGFLFMAILYFYVDNKKDGYLYFFLFFMFCMLGAFLISIRPHVGDFIGIVFANLLLVSGYAVIPYGIRRIFRLSKQDWFYLVVVVTYLIFFVYATYIDFNISIRVYSLNIILLVVMGFALYSLRLAKRKHEDLKEVLSISLWAVIVAILLRLINITINQESADDFLSYQLDAFFIVVIGVSNLFIIPGIMSIFRALQEQELKDLSRIDVLTGLANRRSLIDNVERLSLQSKREKIMMSVFMIDIDEFKKYNDKFGHTYGDEILRKVAEALKSVVRRPLDVVSRYGGEEFVLVLYECDYNGARLRAKSIVEEIKKLEIFIDDKKHNQLTVSIGYVTFISSDEYDFDEVIKIADEKMYLAKSAMNTHFLGKELKIKKE